MSRIDTVFEGMTELSVHLALGNNIRNIRKDRGLKLKQVSKLTGISIPMLSHIECGTSSPTIEVLQKLSLVFDYPVREFFNF